MKKVWPRQLKVIKTHTHRLCPHMAPFAIERNEDKDEISSHNFRRLPKGTLRLSPFHGWNPTVGVLHRGMEQVHSYSSKGISQGLTFSLCPIWVTHNICVSWCYQGLLATGRLLAELARLEYTRSWKSNAVVMGVLSMRVALGSVFRTKSVCVCVCMYVHAHTHARTHTCTHLCVIIILFKVIRPGVWEMVQWWVLAVLVKDLNWFPAPSTVTATGITDNWLL